MDQRNKRLRPDEASRGSNELTIGRLSAYLKAIGKLGKPDEVSVARLLEAAQDITPRQLAEDLRSMGFDETHTIARYALTRAIGKRIRTARLESETLTVAPFVIPSPDSLLHEFAGLTDQTHALQAEMIEVAHEYAEHRPDLFLLGHGLFSHEMVQEEPEPGQAPEDRSAPVKKEVVAYKHQIEEARRIVEQFLGSSVVVHEVGLGKTLTAILILCELLFRDPGLTSLILVPTNLRKQWIEELAKCRDVEVYLGRNLKEVSSQPNVLMAIDTAKEQRWEKILAKRTWGLVIVDEGHILRNDDTVRYRFVYSLRSRYRILLTATPVHNSAYDIFHQVNIVRPGLLGRKAVFAEAHMNGERQVADPEDLRARLKKAVSQMRRENTGLAFPSRDIEHVLVTRRSKLERELYDDVLSVLRGIYRRSLGSAAYIRRPSGKEQGIASIVLVAILVLRELASHPLAALKTLSESLVKRVAAIAKVTRDATDLEALQKALERIANRYAKVEWGEGSHSKTDRLIKDLPRLVKAHGRVIVYVEFRETQKVIIERLQSKKGRAALPPKTDIISYHGALSLADKDHQIDRFKAHPHACFVSTDAGGQGLNLQKGHVVVNFDFPWNPMRVEQRIGRVDRLRQKAPKVIIKNFITKGTIEQYVYDTLREKLKVCDDVLGHLMPQIFKLRGIQEKYCSEDDLLGIGQIILSSENEKDLEQKFKSLDDDLDENLSHRERSWRPTRRWIND
jgi:hypothetical protein